MALTFHTFKYLEKLKNENFFFGETLSLGRLNNLINNDEFKTLKISTSNDEYADEILFENFNIKSLNSLDFSKFENADIIYDLNEPIEKLDKQFDTILDFGTSEHVFNISQCLKNISDLCKISGHIIHCLPANNNCGHGFWQFSPELFFNIYSKKNGFEDTEIFLINLFDKKNWYKINKQELGERLELNSSEPLYILVKTKKIGPNHFKNINQSDYEYQWSDQTNIEKNKKSFLSLLNRKIKNKFKHLLKTNMITKNLYLKIEKTKLHNKNNFKVSKNLEKKSI